MLLADAVISEARRLVTLPQDKAAREALRKERLRIKDSADWFDQLIVERMALDAEREKAAS